MACVVPGIRARFVGGHCRNWARAALEACRVA